MLQREPGGEFQPGGLESGIPLQVPGNGLTVDAARS